MTPNQKVKLSEMSKSQLEGLPSEGVNQLSQQEAEQIFDKIRPDIVTVLYDVVHDPSLTPATRECDDWRPWYFITKQSSGGTSYPTMFAHNSSQERVSPTALKEVFSDLREKNNTGTYRIALTKQPYPSLETGMLDVFIRQEGSDDNDRFVMSIGFESIGQALSSITVSDLLRLEEDKLNQLLTIDKIKRLMCDEADEDQSAADYMRKSVKHTENRNGIRARLKELSSETK